MTCVLEFNFPAGCLTTLTASRLNCIDDKIINECGEVGDVRIGRGTSKKPAPVALSSTRDQS